MNNAGGIPYIATKDLSFEGKINYLNGVFIPNEDEKKFRIAKANSVFICAEGGSAGRKIAFSDQKCFFVNKLFCLEAWEEVLPKYIYYFLKSEVFQKQFKGALRGVIGGVSLSKIKAFKITYPPLPAQKQIVEQLDATFADIDKAISVTQKNIDNAEALFQSFLDSLLYENKKDDDSWVECPLHEVLKNRPRNGYSPPKVYQGTEGTPVLTLSSVTGNSFKPDKIIFTKAPLKKTSHYWIQNGDLLITRSNTKELVGHVAIVKGIHNPTIYPDLIMKMNANEKYVLAEFLFYYLQTSRVRTYIKKNAKGANPTMVKINQGVVKNIPVQAPSKEKQIQLLRRLEKIQSHIQISKELLSKKLMNYNSLKFSVLSQAFSGELH
jgi:type I restriction enzyme S subunit